MRFKNSLSLRFVPLVIALSLVMVAGWALASRAEETKLANTLRWTTASEVDNYGFDVYRGDSEEGPFVRLTASPIEGAGTSDVPSEYAYEDTTIEAGKIYYYYVESIAMDGRREHFTPVVKVKAKYPPGQEPAPEKPPASTEQPAGEGQ